MSRRANTEAESAQRLRKKRQKKREAGWLNCARGILPPTGALAQKIKFQTFTNKAFMEEVLRPSQ